MAKNITIESGLAQAERELEQKLKAVRDEHQLQVETLMSHEKNKVADALKTAVSLFELVPERYREEVLKDADIAKLLRHFGVTSRKHRASGLRTRRPKVEDSQILALLGSEMLTKDVAAKLSLADGVTGQRLGKLLKAKQVTVRKEGLRKYWKRG